MTDLIELLPNQETTTEDEVLELAHVHSLMTDLIELPPYQETTTEDKVQKLTPLKLTAEYHLVTEDRKLKTGLYIDEEGIVKATLDKANWHRFRHTQFQC